MNLFKLCLISLTALMVSNSAIAANRACAVQVDIGGIGLPVDVAAMNTIKQVIGFAVANGVIDKYIEHNDGIHLPIEGGFSAYAHASPSTTEFGAFVQQLRAIKANRATSFYSVKTLTDSCPQDVAFCTMDVKMCPDGSFVGRTAPSCAFAPCPSPVK